MTNHAHLERLRGSSAHLGQRNKLWGEIACGIVLLVLTACATTSTPAPKVQVEGDLAAAAREVAKDLSTQISRDASNRTMVIDPILERKTGQQTQLSLEFENALVPALNEFIKPLSLMPFDAKSAAETRYVLTATVLASDSVRFTVNASITDRPTGLVVAQSVALFRKSNADQSPTRFYSESPSLMRDRSTDGYLRTSETPKGSLADALYVSQVPTSGLLAEALNAYQAGQFERALSAYDAAASRSDGQQLRTFNGIYLTNTRLNRAAAATEAFGKIAALGFATNNLSMKLLFTAGSSTEFWPGKEFAGAYPMWLRQIARAADRAKSCLEVVGHSSRTGTEGVNDRLSLARAETVRRLLSAEVAALGRKVKVRGVGFRENIVGNGKDDASDAIDRRVEFRVEPCPP